MCVCSQPYCCANPNGIAYLCQGLFEQSESYPWYGELKKEPCQGSLPYWPRSYMFLKNALRSPFRAQLILFVPLPGVDLLAVDQTLAEIMNPFGILGLPRWALVAVQCHNSLRMTLQVNEVLVSTLLVRVICRRMPFQLRNLGKS